MPAPWTFTAAPLEPYSCRVLALNGEETLTGENYFDILLLVAGVGDSDAPTLQQDLMTAPRLTLDYHRANGDVCHRHGMAAEVSLLFSAGGEAGTVLRVVMRPHSHRLSLNTHSRIYLHMRLPQILARALKDEKFVTGLDFSDNLRSDYPARPYTCQYNESSGQFLRRHLERVGAYAFIQQEENADVLALVDAATPVDKLPLRDELDWSQDHADETVFSFTRSLSATPTKVTLRDYSTEQPGATGKSAPASQFLRGGGELNIYANCNIYGEVDTTRKDFIAEDAAKAAVSLAETRARALVAAGNRAGGESSVPWMQAGYAITLGGESYLLTWVRHACVMAEDTLEDRVVRRAREHGFVPGTATGYRNSFTCHPQSVGGYAPLPLSPRPVVNGVLHAVVDAAGDGEYAMLDGHGRYQVKFAFPESVVLADSDQVTEGNFSIPLRMAQPHAGTSSGIHFPLLKGVEVLVACTDGDPDRPVILSALPNPAHPSVVADKNQDENLVQTPGGHKISMIDTEGRKNMTISTPGGQQIIMNDKEGERELRLQSPLGGGYIRLKEKK
jgi:type VI secretion system secreted protein VgrG